MRRRVAKRVTTPEDPRFLNALGSSLRESKRHKDARRAYEAAIAADSSCADPHASRAVLHQVLDEPDQAIDGDRAYLELEPEDGEAQQNLGLLLVTQGREEEAAASFEAAARHLTPVDAGKATRLGVRHFFCARLDEAERLDEAIGELEAVVDTASGYPQARENLSVACNSAGRPKKAFPVLVDAIARHPQSASTLPNLDYAYQDAGRIAEAEACFGEVAANPEASPAHVLQAEQTLKQVEGAATDD
jgi:tetratricopeptide (TPR) repeat protein